VTTVEALQFGAISLISDPCGSTYESLMRREHGSRVISLDPNIRPGFITDTAAPGPHRPDDRHERYHQDVGRGSRMVWAARHGDRGRFWLGQGPSLVVFTRGAKGRDRL
jgi:fructokinase